MSEQLQIRFVGNADVKPAKLRARELAQIIQAYEDAIATLVVEQNPEITKEVIAISLVGIEDQSIGLAFVPNLPGITMPAAIQITDAIRLNRFDDISVKVRESLRKIVSVVTRLDCQAYFLTKIDSHVSEATLTPQTVIPQYVELTGETILYGEVRRVGGADPKVEFRTIDGKTLYCPTTKAIAVELANRLYQSVAVRGQAKWSFETSDVVFFVIDEVLTYRYTPIAEAFHKLREASGGVFDSIDDVNQFVGTQREDGEVH